MARNADILSHWHLLIEGFQTSSLDFYAKVEASIAERQLPDVSTERVEWSEGGLGSAKRTYLRVKRGKLTFDICGAQYGTGHFFSWWMAEQASGMGPFAGCLTMIALFIALAWLVVSKGVIVGFAFFAGILAVLLVIVRGSSTDDELLNDIIVSIPVIGWLYSRFFLQLTYYRMDTRLMFQQSVHRAVASVVEDLNDEQGLRALRSEELQPTLRDLLK